MQTVVVHKGIAYFSTFEKAREFGSAVGMGYPAWRVVHYERGWAVQTRPSGDYFGANGIPSMQNAINAFDRA